MQMTNTVWIWIIAIAAIAAELIFYLVQKKKQDRLSEKAMDLVMHGNLDELDQLVDSPEMQKRFPLYNRLYLKLNASIMRGNLKKTDELFEEIGRTNMTDQQKAAYAMMGFQYYLPLERKEECGQYKVMLDTMKGNEAMKKYADQAFGIVYDGQTDSLEALLKKNQTANPAQKAINEFLIAKTYENLGDRDNALKYHQLSNQHLQESAKQRLKNS
jgi:hypothetical protein